MRRSLRVVVPVITSFVLLTGLAFPAAAALPLKRKTCGARITSSFRLKNDLDCTGDGLKVRANGITIDLNGRSLSGDGGEGDYGIDNSRGFDGVKIISGPGNPRALIHEFYVGVQVGQGARRNSIKRLAMDIIYHDGIDIDGGNGHKVLKNRVTNAADEGIELDGNGALIRGNDVLNNAGTGIKVEGDVNDIEANGVFFSAGGGISVDGELNKVDGNEVKANADFGVQVIAGSLNRVTNNQVCENGEPQIEDNGDGTTVTGNSVSTSCG